MYNYIMVRYGELGTKGKNKRQFINKLFHNIKNNLKKFADIQIINRYERIYIKLNGVDHNLIIEHLKLVAGISSYSPVVFLKEQDLNKASELALELIKDTSFKTFKVITRRADKNFATSSMDATRVIAGHVLRNTNLSVDVHNPELNLHLEIRTEGMYVFYERHAGLGGFPLGIGGQALLMLSGGIDSPVAGFEMMKKGVEVGAIHFESPPYTSEMSKQKVITLAEKLNLVQSKIKLYIINFTKIQERIYEKVDEPYAITIMRRMMFRIADIIARRDNYLAIVSGESIGQVASQTLESIQVINEVSNFPVIRPLATFDKQDVINIARKIDTYETSIIPYEDCCTIFTPRNPVIKPRLDKAEFYESRFEWESLIEEAVASVQVIYVTNEEKQDNFL